MSVVIAWLSGGQVEHPFMDSMVDLMRHDSHSNGYVSGFISMVTSPRVAEARSQIVDTFAEKHPDADWLLFIDADMTFQPDMLDRLMEVADRERCPILGGLCFGGRPGSKIFPTVYEEYETGDGYMALRPSAYYPKDTLVKVGGTGAACLLVHRSVYAAMARPWPEGFGTTADGAANPYPWFTEGLTGPHGESYGEDIAFCKRARQLDIPVHVHTGVKLGHVKTCVMDEPLYEAWLTGQEAQIKAEAAAKPNRAELRRAAREKAKAHA